LKGLLDPNRLAQWAVLPEQVLQSITVLANEDMIKDATYEGYDTPDGKRFKMGIDLTDDGRNRLWQYSKNNMNKQLLLVEDGVAIAAPQIKSELRDTRMEIAQLPDEGLVQDTIKLIKDKKGSS
jgi:preprotein translocase subunit SecD